MIVLIYVVHDSMYYVKQRFADVSVVDVQMQLASSRVCENVKKDNNANIINNQLHNSLS